MSEPNKPFVVTDRRKFTSDGTPRPDADPSPERAAREAAAQATEPQATAPESQEQPQQAAPADSTTQSEAASPTEAELPPAPTAAEMEQANAAFQQTAERLDTAVRAANPGMDHPPAMTFDQILTSIYMTTILQLGGTTQEGQQPKVDLMGARQSIDMLGILADKTRGNLTPAESALMDNALFEVRMGFLEVTQALAHQAASRQPPPPGSSTPGRPSIVR